jgi:peptidoglycan hydrolase-like protein with peptidoglycan-binding domain
MQRVLTAAAVVALSMGMAGVSQAQTAPTTPSTSAPSAATPGMTSPSHPNSGMTSQPTPATPSPSAMSPSPGPSAASSPSATNPSGYISPQQVKQAQRVLQQKGLYHGQIDGLVGPQTQAALSQFQQSEGLPQTATLDQDTLNHLLGQGSVSPGAASTGSTMPPSSKSQPTGRSGY